MHSVTILFGSEDQCREFIVINAQQFLTDQEIKFKELPFGRGWIIRIDDMALTMEIF